MIKVIFRYVMVGVFLLGTAVFIGLPFAMEENPFGKQTSATHLT